MLTLYLYHLTFNVNIRSSLPLPLQIAVQDLKSKKKENIDKFRSKHGNPVRYMQQSNVTQEQYLVQRKEDEKILRQDVKIER